MMKKIWQPLALGSILGSFAGITSVTGLLIVVPSNSTTDNAIGFYMTLLLLSASLSGPLGGVAASTILLIISLLFGPPEMKAILGEPAIFWTNLAVVGALQVFVGLAYRQMYERLEMPARLLPWAGCVIFVYLLNSPLNITLQEFFSSTAGAPGAILSSYKTFVPQALFDVFVTSMVFVALPTRYRRPLWTDRQSAAGPTE